MAEGAETAMDHIAARVRSAMATEDLAALAPLLSDDARWGSCVGRAQVVDYMTGALSAGGDVEVVDVSAHPDRVVVELRLGSPGVDEHRDRRQHLFQVLFVRDGRVVELQGHGDRDDALGADPSPPPPAPSGSTRIDGMAAVLPVRDLAAALDHYGRLGFRVSTYEGGGYGYAQRDAADLHLAEHGTLDPRSTTSAVYLYVGDADALYAEWRGSGVTGQFFEPHDTDYGLREGAHIDRDGNLLRFGSSLPD